MGDTVVICMGDRVADGSELDFGFDEGVHLVHVAGEPHEPHRDGADDDGDEGDPN